MSVVQYPDLVDILRHIAMDNGLNFSPAEIEWGKVNALCKSTLGVSVQWLDMCAARITSSEEKETFAVGEQTEQEELVRKYKIKTLSEFMNLAFDGEEMSPLLFWFD